MTTKTADASVDNSKAMDASFEETVQNVKQEWRNFWTYMCVFGSLVMLVIMFFR